MQLRFNTDQGQPVTVRLGAAPITVGRSEKADIVLTSGNVSPLHCSIRQWDNDYVIKNLDSANQTYVNGQIADVARLDAGDKITVGGHNLFFERISRKSPGANTMIRTIGKEMSSEKKGYSAMLGELVMEAEKKKDP